MKIIIRNLQKRLPIYPIRIKKAALKTLSAEHFNKSGELTFCFVNDKAISKFNLKYLKKNRPTDVMAFDLSLKKGKICADIIISTDTAARNAKIFKTTAQQELSLYVIHGILHILGYDDRIAQQKKLMRRREAEILTSLCPSTKPTR